MRQIIANVFNMADVRPAVGCRSPNTGDGKSFFAANLAVAFSQLGSRTIAG